jgi:DNA-binding HxlR family transcriptional regulator
VSDLSLGYLSFEFQFGLVLHFGSVQADQSIDLPSPVWLHDATTHKMLASSIMMQLDLMAIKYEELCDTNPSKPTCAPWHARSIPSANWWSLLIVRDALSGIRRFSDFQKSLGLAKNVLSARLKKLVACGIMEQVPASDGSAYREYALTQKGRELFPVIVALRQWGESYLFSRGEKRLQVLDKRTGKPPRLEVQNAKGETVTADDLELVTVTNGRSRRPTSS